MNGKIEPRLYSLSFLTPKGETPCLVCTVSKEWAQELEKLLGNVVQEYDEGKVAQYLEEPSSFVRFEDDRFGFGECGRRWEEDGKTHYGFQYTAAKHAPHLCLTISIFFDALGRVGALAPERLEKTNHPQLITLQPMCGLTRHPLVGRVYPSLGSWLLRMGKKNSEPSPYSREAYQGFPYLPEVKTAMGKAWSAVAPRGQKRYSKDCYVGISEDGRFILSCFGNACDVGIYPDLTRGLYPTHPTQFSCHNLDLPYQQLTLLAGLAKMHEVASRELE